MNDQETIHPCPKCENDTTLRPIIGQSVECDKCGLILSFDHWQAIGGTMINLAEEIQDCSFHHGNKSTQAIINEFRATI